MKKIVLIIIFPFWALLMIPYLLIVETWLGNILAFCSLPMIAPTIILSLPLDLSGDIGKDNSDELAVILVAVGLVTAPFIGFFTHYIMAGLLGIYQDYGFLNWIPSESIKPNIPLHEQ